MRLTTLAIAAPLALAAPALAVSLSSAVEAAGREVAAPMQLLPLSVVETAPAQSGPASIFRRLFARKPAPATATPAAPEPATTGATGPAPVPVTGTPMLPGFDTGSPEAAPSAPPTAEPSPKRARVATARLPRPRPDAPEARPRAIFASLYTGDTEAAPSAPIKAMKPEAPAAADVAALPADPSAEPASPEPIAAEPISPERMAPEAGHAPQHDAPAADAAPVDMAPATDTAAETPSEGTHAAPAAEQAAPEAVQAPESAASEPSAPEPAPHEAAHASEPVAPAAEAQATDAAPADAPQADASPAEAHAPDAHATDMAAEPPAHAPEPAAAAEPAPAAPDAAAHGEAAAHAPDPAADSPAATDHAESAPHAAEPAPAPESSPAHAEASPAHGEAAPGVIAEPDAAAAAPAHVEAPHAEHADGAAEVRPMRSMDEVGTPPYELVLQLQEVQDAIARGSKEAFLAQRPLLVRIEREFELAPAGVWQDSRNAAALVTYVLSGGKPMLLRKLLAQDPPPAIDEGLMRGALAYVEGRVDEASTILLSIDARSLPPSMAGQAAIAQAALVVGTDPQRAEGYLAIARLLSPGTLAEEAALRREIVVAAELQNTDHFENLARQYMDRYRHSVYAGNFRQRFAAALTRMKLLDDPSQFPRLDDILAELEPEARRELYVIVARAAVVQGKTKAAQFAAERAIALAEPGSPDLARATLYRAAAMLVEPDGLEPTRAALKTVDRAVLEPSDQDLYDVVATTADLIRTASDPMVMAKETADVTMPETEINALPSIKSAEAALKVADALLEQAK